METTLRNGDLAVLGQMLSDQHARKLDVVAPASQIRAWGGDLTVTGSEAVLTDDGVTSADGRYRLTDVAVEGVADKLKIPLPYVRRMHADRPDLFDVNVNGWLQGGRWHESVLDAHGVGAMSDQLPDVEPDGRSFLLRCYREDDGGVGICRAVLSNGYRMIDDLDVLTAALIGVRDAGVDVQVKQCDLTERRMYVKIAAPSVEVAAPGLLAGYRSPFTGNTGADNPTVFAGFVLANSEVGCGAMTLTPQITVRVCDNGMTMTRDVLRNVHLGGRMDHGVVKFSDETQQRSLALVESQARDAVATFLDPAYVQAKVIELEERAETRLSDPAAAVADVTKALKYTDQQTADVLRMFIEGGQTTAGGIMHAVTAAAQEQTSADVAYAMEADALPALELAASGGY